MSEFVREVDWKMNVNIRMSISRELHWDEEMTPKVEWLHEFYF